MSVTKSTAMERRPSSWASAKAGNRWPPVPPAASMTDGDVTELMASIDASGQLRNQCRCFAAKASSEFVLVRAPPAERDTRQSLHQRAEGVAPDLEVAVVIEGSAGGRKQHDRLAGIAGGCVTCGRSDGVIEGAAALELHLVLQCRGELLGRLAYQVGFGDAREVGLERGDAALLRPAAEDPKDIAVEGGKRRGGAVGIGGLAVVDEERAPDPANLLEAMRQSGKGCERVLYLRRRYPELHRGGACSERVLHVVLAAQRGDAGEVRETAERPRPRRAGDQLGAYRIPAVADARARRDDVDPRAVGEPQALGDVAAPVVVIADDGML